MIVEKRAWVFKKPRTILSACGNPDISLLFLVYGEVLKLLVGPLVGIGVVHVLARVAVLLLVLRVRVLPAEVVLLRRHRHRLRLPQLVPECWNKSWNGKSARWFQIGGWLFLRKETHKPVKLIFFKQVYMQLIFFLIKLKSEWSNVTWY